VGRVVATVTGRSFEENRNGNGGSPLLFVGHDPDDMVRGARGGQAMLLGARAAASRRRARHSD
jgi:hypothetical protein